MQVSETKGPRLLPLVLVLLGLIFALHLGGALLGKPLYRASHLGTALQYAHGSINLLRPVIVGFNATGTPTALELPVWQAAAALAFKLAHSTWYGWANLVSLLLFATSLWPFLQLARQYVGHRAAGWATAFFLAEPLIVIMAGEAATDGLCLTAMLWFIFFADKMVRTESAWWWWPAALFALLSALLKVPLFFAAGLFTLCLPLANGLRPWRPWTLLAGMGAVAAVAFTLWTRHADSLAAQALYPYTELRLSRSPWLVHWYFGDLHYRLSPGPWLKGGWRFLHGTMGTLPLSALLVAAFVRPGNLLPKLWLLAAFPTTLLFTHLVLEHWHFYLMCAPAVAMLCGATLARWEPFWAAEMPVPFLRIALAGAVLLFSALDGVITMKVAADYDCFPRQISAEIVRHTNPGDRLLVYTCDPIWGGEVLFRSGRKGLCVPVLQGGPDGPTPKGLFDLLDNQADLNRLKSLGYNKLVLVSESPVRYAVAASNPGSKRLRARYPDKLPTRIEAWPDVWRTEDILIKGIP
ncbi:MAG: hypothetical protein ACLQVX_23200 [Limisphaerales bacterium]